MKWLTKLRTLWNLELELAQLEVEDLKRLLQQAQEVAHRCETKARDLEALRAHDLAEIGRLKSDALHWRTTASNWESSYNDVLKKLNEQASLNADFLQNHFLVELDAKAHTGLVDNQKVQVLTQLTARRLNIRVGLLGALHDAFSLNVARHLIKKLSSGRHLTHEPMSESEYRKLSHLPPGSPPDEPKQLNG